MKAALPILAVCCALVTGAVAAPVAWAADDAQAKSRAQLLLTEGTAAYGRGDYAAALDKFTAAYKIFPSPKLWFNIGQANRDLGRPVEAVAAFDRFLDDAGNAPPETLAEARRSAAELKTKLGQIKVTLANDGAEITVDGKPVGSAPLGQMIWTTPGRHQVAVQQQGFSPAIEDVVVAAGKVAAIDIALRPIDLRPANATAGGALVGGGAAAGDAERKPIYRRAWFWVAAAAVVAAGAATAIILATRGDSGPTVIIDDGVPDTTLGAQRTF
jgi:tetratricopeptide (TPR) repeat protein